MRGPSHAAAGGAPPGAPAPARPKQMPALHAPRHTRYPQEARDLERQLEHARQAAAAAERRRCAGGGGVLGPAGVKGGGQGWGRARESGAARALLPAARVSRSSAPRLQSVLALPTACLPHPLQRHHCGGGHAHQGARPRHAGGGRQVGGRPPPLGRDVRCRAAGPGGRLGWGSALNFTVPSAPCCAIPPQAGQGSRGHAPAGHGPAAPARGPAHRPRRAGAAGRARRPARPPACPHGLCLRAACRHRAARCC